MAFPDTFVTFVHGRTVEDLNHGIARCLEGGYIPLNVCVHKASSGVVFLAVTCRKVRAFYQESGGSPSLRVVKIAYNGVLEGFPTADSGAEGRLEVSSESCDVQFIEVPDGVFAVILDKQ
jgi:hypothetical protein